MPRDKYLHLVYGSIISAIMIFSFGTTGFILCIIGFALKELLHDYLMEKGTAELMDFIFSAIPSVIIYIVYLLIF